MNYSDFIYDFNLYLCERFGETVVPSCTTLTAFVFLYMSAKWIYTSVSENVVVA